MSHDKALYKSTDILLYLPPENDILCAPLMGAIARVCYLMWYLWFAQFQQFSVSRNTGETVNKKFTIIII